MVSMSPSDSREPLFLAKPAEVPDALARGLPARAEHPSADYLPEAKRKQWLVSRWVGLTQADRDAFRAALDAADGTRAESSVV
jgi:hypothetical protein